MIDNTTNNSSVLTLEKQYELMYTDAVNVSYEVKRSIDQNSS